MPPGTGLTEKHWGQSGGRSEGQARTNVLLTVFTGKGWVRLRKLGIGQSAELPQALGYKGGPLFSGTQP